MSKAKETFLNGKEDNKDNRKRKRKKDKMNIHNKRIRQIKKHNEQTKKLIHVISHVIWQIKDQEWLSLLQPFGNLCQLVVREV